MSSDNFVPSNLDAILRTPALPRAMAESGAFVIRPAPDYVKYRFCQLAVTHLLPLYLIGHVLFSAEFMSGMIGGFSPRKLLADIFHSKDWSAHPMVKLLVILVLILFSLAMLAVILRLVMGVLLVQLDALRRYYIFTDQTLTVREGLTTIREMTFTYANIQDVRLDAGPLCRIFGIANVTVETAGGSGGAESGGSALFGMHRANLVGLAEAEAVRDALIQRQQHWRDAGHGNEAPIPAPPATGTSEVLQELAAEAAALRVAAERLVFPQA